MEQILSNPNWALPIKCLCIIVLFAILGAIFKIVKPKIKGVAGEAAVAMLLSKLNKDDYIVLNNVMLSTEGVEGANINSSQIDHVIVSKYGLFSIETKNYTGWITGSENGAKWTQTIYKTKNTFMNPIRQNYGHVKALEAVLDRLGMSAPIYPIVAFPGDADLKVKVEKSDVVYWGQIVSTITKHSTDEVLSEDQMRVIVDYLQENNIDSHDSRKEHVKSIKQEKAGKQTDAANDQAAVQEGICPKCGGNLIERDGKYGKFYGCSNYPKCRFTKEI